MNPIIFLSFCIYTALAAPSPVEDPLQLLSVANKQFATAVYREILKTNKGNLIFSPFSAETVLALTSEGSKGDTRKELIAALHLPEAQEKIQKAFKEILPKLKQNDDDVKLLAANKIYADHDVKLENDFKKIAVDIYDSCIENLDFAKNVEAANTINQWVEKQTNKKIQNLISPDVINSDTALVLVNALYLSAHWLKPFDEYETLKETFYKSAKETLQLPVMQNVEYFNYHENKQLNAQFLELDYYAPNLTMVIALPNEQEGLSALECNLEKVFEPQQWSEQIVEVKLPRFTINSQIPLVDILKDLGAKKMFNSSAADLTGLSSTHKNLYVSEVIQKAFINVTESGTEAAAATAEVIQTRSGKEILVPEKKFHATHPFLYTIKFNDVILFAGRVVS